MENFKQEKIIRPKSEYVYSEQIEEIALRAAKMKEFQDAVKEAGDRLNAIKAVRKILPNHFPEINEIPAPEIKSPGIMGPTANDFMIAKNIVELLYEKTKI